MTKVLIFYSPFSRTGSTSTGHIESNAGPTCDAVVGQFTNQQKRNRTFWPFRLTSNPFTFSTTILDVEVRPWLGFRRRRRKLHRPGDRKVCAFQSDFPPLIDHVGQSRSLRLCYVVAGFDCVGWMVIHGLVISPSAWLLSLGFFLFGMGSWSIIWIG